jgi:hypothetical protein
MPQSVFSSDHYTLCVLIYITNETSFLIGKKQLALWKYNVDSIHLLASLYVILKQAHRGQL